jgi:hypothetical protein
MLMQIVYIVWKDTCHLNNWKHITEIAEWAENAEVSRIVTVGWLVGEGEDWIVVSPTVSHANKQAHSPMKIYNDQIEEITYGYEETESD